MPHRFLPRATLITALLALSACVSTRNDLTHTSYSFQTDNFKRTANCFIRQAQDDLDINESVHVTRLDEPEEVRVSHDLTLYGSTPLWEADFINGGNGNVSFVVIARSSSAHWWRQKHIFDKLGTCGASPVEGWSDQRTS